ncbi:MAG: excinuclease ABC subunit UvrA [Cytophagales bacterium]
MKTTEHHTHAVDSLDPKEFIIIKNARVNNLKNVSVAIPRNKLVVITGLSGSGKSSLAFDTLYAEGQRVYVESLNSYARQFLARMEKPDVDYIKGISPAIAIEQKVGSKNPRSTVGTTTEIYDYLKLLYARIGKTYSPVSLQEVKKDTVADVINYIQSLPAQTRYLVTTPLLPKEDRSIQKELEILLQKGFTRVLYKEETVFIEDILAHQDLKHDYVQVLIDRGVIAEINDDFLFRISDSAQTAFFEGDGVCTIHVVGGEQKTFSDKFELDGILFEEPSVNFFAFNNPYGACKTCEGFGNVLGIDEDLVIPNKTLSVYEGCIAPWKGEKMGEWLTPLVKNGIKFDFPIHRSYKDLDPEHKQLIWEGNEYFDGLHTFFKYLESQVHKIQYRVMLSKYRGRTVCPDCRGTRLRKDASYVKVNGKSIQDVVLMPVDEALQFFNGLSLTSFEEKVAKRILVEIQNRLSYLDQVGLGYLTLNRLTQTLSGGEFQRIRLATALGSALVGSMYILDEPSIGLHPRDTQRLIKVLEQLRDLGNTVVVVEHEEEVMRSADQIIDIGPDAGARGGELIFQENLEELLNKPATDTLKTSHTYRFLAGIDKEEEKSIYRQATRFIEIYGARENNLKHVDVKIPLNIFTVVTGVSGSGKSTLIKKILYPALYKATGGFTDETTGKYDSIDGSLAAVQRVEFVDQNPIGKSSRSNPITFIKAYDHIRNLYASQHLSTVRQYKPSHFSFNVEGGRCETCQGEGQIKIEMQFMADIYLTCESCHGHRFKQEILEVTYQEKSISDVLQLTVDEAVDFFKNTKKIVDRIKVLQDVGLGYIQLGQSANTLSGGEAQRVKLASYLGAGAADYAENMFFIFDEPTTGLHPHDISKLLKSLNALVEQGNSVLVIEHNMEVITQADWVIDLGPDGGINGGNICFEGTPKELTKLINNHTANFLKKRIG